MDLTAIFTTALIVGFSGAMMPGPLLTVTIGEAARRGFIAGPLIVLGHAVLELALVIGLSFGLAAVLTAAGVTRAIGIVGGLFLVYMGWGMSRDAYLGRVVLDVAAIEKDRPLPAGGDTARKGMHPVLAGIFISLSNPYWSLWWATVGLEFITRAMRQGAIGLTSFFTGHILADLVWYCLIAGVVAGGRRFLSQQVYRVILVVCGLFLIGLGGYFIYDAVT